MGSVGAGMGTMGTGTMGQQAMLPSAAENIEFIAKVIANATSDQLIRFRNEAYMSLRDENIAYKSQLATLK